MNEVYFTTVQVTVAAAPTGAGENQEKFLGIYLIPSLSISMKKLKLQLCWNGPNEIS